MARIGKTAASLRFFGDDLDPDELSALLHAEPTFATRKGEARISSSGREVVSRTGSWRLHVDERTPGDLNGQIEQLLGRLTSDVQVWKDLARRYRADVFCGLFMTEGNEGEELTPATLMALGARGLLLGLDIYDSD